MSANLNCFDQQMKSGVQGCLLECFHMHRQRRTRRNTGSTQAPPVLNVDQIGSFNVKQYVEQHLPQEWINAQYKPNIIETVSTVLTESQSTGGGSNTYEASSQNDLEEDQELNDLQHCVCNCYAHCAPSQPAIQEQSYQTGVQQWNAATPNVPVTQTRIIYVNCDQQVPMPPNIPTPEIPQDVFYPVPPPSNVPIPCPEPVQYRPLPPIPDCVPTVYQLPPVVLPPTVIRIPCPEPNKYIPLPPPAPIPDCVPTVYQQPPPVLPPNFVPMPCPEPPQYFPLPPPPTESFYQELPPPPIPSSFIPDCVPTTVYQPPPVITPPPFVPMPCPEPVQYVPSPPPPPPECFYQELPPQPIPTPSLPLAPLPPVQETFAHQERFCARCCCVPGSSLVKRVVYRQAQDTGGQQEEASADFSSVIDQLETKITVRYGDEIMTQDGTCISGNYNEQLRVIDFPVQVSDELPYDMEALATTY